MTNGDYFGSKDPIFYCLVVPIKALKLKLELRFFIFTNNFSNFCWVWLAICGKACFPNLACQKTTALDNVQEPERVFMTIVGKPWVISLNEMTKYLDEVLKAFLGLDPSTESRAPNLNHTIGPTTQYYIIQGNITSPLYS